MTNKAKGPAGLVRRAEEWGWSSLHYRLHEIPQSFLRPWPVPMPPNWVDIVNEPFPADEARRIRRCIAKGLPYGDQGWCAATAELMEQPQVTAVAAAS